MGAERTFARAERGRLGKQGVGTRGKEGETSRERKEGAGGGKVEMEMEVEDSKKKSTRQGMMRQVEPINEKSKEGWGNEVEKERGGREGGREILNRDEKGTRGQGSSKKGESRKQRELVEHKKRKQEDREQRKRRDREREKGGGKTTRLESREKRSEGRTEAEMKDAKVEKDRDREVKRGGNERQRHSQKQKQTF